MSDDRPLVKKCGSTDLGHFGPPPYPSHHMHSQIHGVRKHNSMDHARIDPPPSPRTPHNRKSVGPNPPHPISPNPPPPNPPHPIPPNAHPTVWMKHKVVDVRIVCFVPPMYPQSPQPKLHSPPMWFISQTQLALFPNLVYVATRTCQNSNGVMHGAVNLWKTSS